MRARLFSCLKEEDPIEPFDRGGITTTTIETGSNGDYSNQLFFDLSQNNVVKTVNRLTWDLAFESSPTGTIIRMNTASKMQASKTGFTHMDSIMDLTSHPLKFDWDRANGMADSMALSSWIVGGVPTQEVFVIDLGETPSFSFRGYKKMQIQSVTNTEYTIAYSDINGDNYQLLTIAKDPSVNHTCFTFSGTGSATNLEPNKDDWDLLFSQYMHTFHDSDPPVSYSVNGVLLNPLNVKAAKVFDKAFAEISMADVANYTLTNQLDVIGYNWKLFDFDTDIYQIQSGQNYIIKDRKGFYYKIRFIDFYSVSGIKGYPKFEFEKL